MTQLATIGRLAEEWRHEANTLRKRRETVIAAVLDDVADELLKELAQFENEFISLKQASKEISRKANRGAIASEGRGKRRRVRRGDLPVKPKKSPLAHNAPLSDDDNLFRVIVASKHGGYDEQ